MGRQATLHLVSLRNCLVNLPLSIHGPLLERGVTPQSLVVELSVQTPNVGGAGKKPATSKVYVGWTGMPSAVVGVAQQVRAGSAAGDRVEMDPQFAAMLGLGLTEGSQVSIELLRDLPAADSVSVTPISADDWEILETNAEFVEMHMLNQARAVYEGMVIGCWVGGTTLVRFTVDQTSPSASPALRLTSDTELIVAPKSRHVPTPAADKSHDLTADMQDSTLAYDTSPEWSEARRKLLRLLPLELMKMNASLSASEEQEAFVSRASFDLIKKAVPSMKLNILHYPRPTSRPSANGESSAAAATGGKEDENTKAEMQKELTVRLKESKEVPEGHIWISETSRRELDLCEFRDGASDGRYELLRLAPFSRRRPRHMERGSSDADKHASSSRPAHSRQDTPKTTLTAPNGSSETKQPELVALAGVEDKLATIKGHVVSSLAADRLLSRSGAASGILITGNSGAGKSSLAQQAARELEQDSRTLTRTVYVDCSKHADERVPTMKGKIKEWFDDACWHAPTLLVLDNLDRMLGAEVEHADSFPALHLTNTFISIALPAMSSRPVTLLATAQSSTSLHPLLSTTHLIGETVSLRGPNKAARRDITKALVGAKTSMSTLDATDLNYTTIAALTEGYLPADLRDLVDRAIHQAAIRARNDDGLLLKTDDFATAQEGFVPLSLRDVKLQKSEVQWADIGGLHETRRTLRETLEWPTKYGAIFASCPLRLRSGLLLYGFPGCGKTLLASAVAKECGLNFISVKGPEILNKYIGASEKSVRDLFERAQAAKPCILFFDEFDSIAPKRGHDSTGVTDRVVNQMLTQMDGAEGLDGVYVLAATSRPDLIDPALLRPGRLDKSLLCDMPSKSDRLEIMQACSRKIALDPSVDLAEYTAQTEGYSGADLQAFIYNAHLDAIHETLTATESAAAASASTDKSVDQDIAYTTFGGTASESGNVLSRAEQAVVTKRLELILSAMASNKGSKSKTAANGPGPTKTTTHVEPRHLEKSLTTTRPSVPSDELARLRRIYSEFVDGRSANGLPSGEASDQVGGRESLM